MPNSQINIPDLPPLQKQRVFVCDACDNLPCYMVARSLCRPATPHRCPYSDGDGIEMSWRDVEDGDIKTSINSGV